MTDTKRLAIDFAIFREECVKLALLLNTFDRVFSEQNRETLKKSSHRFFHDLNTWMIELFIVKCLRLLDQPSTRGRDNLSVFYFERELAESNYEIKRIALELSSYKKNLKSARDRLVAHADRQDLVAQIAYGEHDLDTHLKFRNDLQDFCDEVGREIGVGPSDFINISPMSVFPLIKTLEKGLESQENG